MGGDDEGANSCLLLITSRKPSFGLMLCLFVASVDLSLRLCITLQTETELMEERISPRHYNPIMFFLHSEPSDFLGLGEFLIFQSEGSL